MTDYRNYDEWSAEADGEPGPQVVVAGQKWQLPARHEVSAKAVADFQRLRAVMARAIKDSDLDDEDDVPDEMVDGIIEGMERLTPASLLHTLIGEQADGMLEAGASHEAIERLARDYSTYVEKGTGPLAPEPEPANRAERRAKAKGRGSGSTTSPKGGSSSKPTSPESTDST